MENEKQQSLESLKSYQKILDLENELIDLEKNTPNNYDLGNAFRKIILKHKETLDTWKK